MQALKLVNEKKIGPTSAAVIVAGNLSNLSLANPYLLCLITSVSVVFSDLCRCGPSRYVI